MGDRVWRVAGAWVPSGAADERFWRLELLLVTTRGGLARLSVRGGWWGPWLKEMDFGLLGSGVGLPPLGFNLGLLGFILHYFQQCHFPLFSSKYHLIFLFSPLKFYAKIHS